MILKKYVLELYFSIVSLIYFIIYLPQTYNTQLFIQDDEYILAPIFKATSFLSIYQGEFVDIQPIRDLSYWIDLKMQPFFNFSTFKMTNLFLWYFCFFLIYIFFNQISKTYRLNISKLSCLIIASLVLLHPSMSLPIAWISSRKHLLAFFFILLASLFHLKFLEQKNRGHFIFSQLFYFLSLMSHVIYSPWCLWVSFTLINIKSLKNIRQYYYPFISCFVGAFVSLSNYFFYKLLYTKLNLVNVLGINVGYTKDTILFPFLAFGRYFINFVDMGAVNVLYNIYSPANYCGLFLFVLFIFISLKNFKLPVIRSLFVLFFCASATFTFFILGTFTQNYYALFITTIAFFMIYLLYVNSKLNKSSFQKLVLFFTFAVLTLEISSSAYQANLWKKNIDILRFYKDQEPIADTTFWYLSEKVYSQMRSGIIPPKEFFVEVTELFYGVKPEIESFASPGKVSNNMAFKSYFGYLNLLVNNPYINTKIKDQIIEKICNPFIIYCNFFGSFIKYQLGNKKEASAGYVLFLQKLFRILEHESSRNLYFVNYDFRQQWKLFMDLVANVTEFHKETAPEFYKLLDLIYQRNIDIPLYNPGRSSFVKNIVKDEKYQFLKKITEEQDCNYTPFKQ